LVVGGIAWSIISSTSPAEQAKVDKADVVSTGEESASDVKAPTEAISAEPPVPLPVADKAEADKYIKEHGKNAMVQYLKKILDTETDGKLVSMYVQYFISQGADVNATANKGATPIQFAVGKGNIEAVEALVENGANIHVRTVNGRRLIDIARQKGNIAMIDYLSSLSATGSPQRDFEVGDYLWIIFAGYTLDPSNKTKVDNMTPEQKSMFLRWRMIIAGFFLFLVILIWLFAMS